MVYKIDGMMYNHSIKCPVGEIGRHKGLKIPRLRLYQFESGIGHPLCSSVVEHFSPHGKGPNAGVGICLQAL